MSITLSKLWAIVLVASLAINLFLVGGIAARLAMRGAAEPSATPAETASVRPNLRGLPSFSMPFAIRTLGPEVRPVAREIFRTRRPDFRKKRRAIGQANREAVRLLSASEFDAAPFRKALEVVRVNGVRAQEANHESVVKLVGQLSSEQRQRYAAAIQIREKRRIEERRSRRKFRKGKFRDDKFGRDGK